MKQKIKQPKIKQPTRYVGIHLPHAVYDAIAQRAKENLRSVSAEMRLAAQNHVGKQ